MSEKFFYEILGEMMQKSCKHKE